MKSVPANAKGFLIRLAAEGIAPLVAGCAGALVAGPAGAVVGGVVGKVCEEAVKYFGPAIVESWLAWFRRQPASLQAAAVEAAANLSPAEARQVAEEALKQADVQASPEDLNTALDYVAAIPAAVRRSLVADRLGRAMSVPATMALNNPRQLLSLLPQSLPPYPPGSDLPGTPYRLGELLGTGGFGAVYKATTPTLQHLAFAIKFCLDPSLIDSLKRERANLDRLQSAGTTTTGGAERIVRLYGYDFDHTTPYLVYEFVPGRDLAAHLSGRRAAADRGMAADEALDVVKQVAEALAFAHQRGLVHRDLKPANVLVGESGVKLTDFGIGSVTAQAAQRSRIGSTTLEQLDAAEQATLFRGAGTAVYMSPEQRRGEPADPRHDLFSLGVMWYQLLTGDVTRELHPGWADELLEEQQTPPEHVEALRACVGVMKKRPESGGKLLEILRQRTAPAPEVIPLPTPAASPQSAPAWVPTTEPAATYYRVAERSERRGDATARDRFLTLAADAAFTSGRPDEAERVRRRLATVNPQHVLATFATFEDATRAGHVQAYLKSLRSSNTPEYARQLLEGMPPEPAPAPAEPPAILDAVAAEPKPIGPVEAQKGRDEIVRGIVEAQRVAAKDWRWVLMLIGIITTGIAGFPSLVFATLLVGDGLGSGDMRPWVRILFFVLLAVFGSITILFMTLAICMGSWRGGREKERRLALARAIERVQFELSLPPAPVGHDDLDLLCQVGWDLTREIEERASLPLVVARLHYPGRWAWNTALKAYVDGDFVGEGGRRSGFDLPVRLCRGLHLLELREQFVSGQPQIWRQAFTVGRETKPDVQIVLTNRSLKVEVVGSR